MKHAKHVTINNLDIISEFLYNKLLSCNDIRNCHYKNNLVEVFFLNKHELDNDVLKTELQRLQLYDHWIGTEVFVFQPGYLPAHSDSIWKYSLNIPVKPVDQFYVKFYSSDNLPIKKENYYFDYSECTLNLEQTIVANTPYILNTLIPHDVENSSTSETYTFAFRLSPNLEINIT